MKVHKVAKQTVKRVHQRGHGIRRETSEGGVTQDAKRLVGAALASGRSG